VRRTTRFRDKAQPPLCFSPRAAPLVQRPEGVRRLFTRRVSENKAALSANWSRPPSFGWTAGMLCWSGRKTIQERQP